MTTAQPPQPQDLIDFVVREARILDDKRFEEWNALFTDEAHYWVPAAPGQTDAQTHNSHLYEDKLLRTLRIERLKRPHAYSQQPPSRCHHLLQQPSVEAYEPQRNHYELRTPFHYTESRVDELHFLVGTMTHHLCVQDGQLRIAHKRVDILNCDAALPAIQLFI